MAGKLTPEQGQQLVERYLNGERIRDLMREYHLTNEAIIHRLRRRGIGPRGRVTGSPWVYEINQHYFDEVTTEEQAYWLGFITADGAITYNAQRDNYVFLVHLAEKDAAHLEALRTALASTHPVRMYTRPNGRRYAAFSAANQQIVAGLARYGVVQRKTYTIRIPTALDTSLTRHFLRGYSDGDGGFYEYSNSRRIKWTICSNLDFLRDVSEYLHRQIDTSGSLYVLPKNPRIGQLTVSGRFLVARVAHLLYDDATVHLPRKYPANRLAN